MGRPKNSTHHSDAKIMLALQYKPRRFNEFEWALLEIFPLELPEDAKEKNPVAWNRLKRSHERIWKIPRKTLARRLKALVAKGWVIRKVLPVHGHHVEYHLNFDKRKEMLRELPPLPLLSMTRSQARLSRTLDAVDPLKEEILGLENLPDDEVLEMYLRLCGGEMCPKCFENEGAEKAMNVVKESDGRVYCRNCGREISIEECEEFLEKIMRKDSEKRSKEFYEQITKFFGAIDKQLEEN